MKRAIKVSEISSGKFDVTIYPLMKLWGFYDEKRLPAKQEIAEVLKNVGYRYLVIKNGKMTKTKKGVEVDIGGIAKLYALEEGANVLKKAGIKSALMDAGGDIYAMGQYNGKDWKVGIRNPRGDGVIGALDVSDMLVISSGDYERYFEQAGVRYHHLMDPDTGYPARGLSSVTILCGDPVTADGLSAAVFIMGMEKGFALAKKTGTFEVIAVTEDQKVFYSEGLNKDAKVVKVKNFPTGK
jgi:thiamine biosynthesis lipoprotein